MKFLLIGHTVEDHIRRGDTVAIQPGGIYYAASGLLYFKENEDQLFLQTSYEDANYHLYEAVYNKINLEYSEKRSAIPRVHLSALEAGERCEKYENITDTLNIRTDELNQFDGIYVNMITGFDITLDALKEIRRAYSGNIYMDVHTLSRGLSDDMEREFRLIPKFDEWAACVDILQFNHNEMKTVSKKKDEWEVVEELFSFGVKIVLITKGENGIRLYRKSAGEVESVFLSSIKVPTINRIGCGDIFGTIFFYVYISSGDYYKALRIANTAAGCVATYDLPQKIQRIKDDTLARLD